MTTSVILTIMITLEKLRMIKIDTSLAKEEYSMIMQAAKSTKK